MIINEKKQGTSLLIKFTGLKNGQLDLSNVKNLRTKFHELISNNESHFILDFFEVSYIDSSIIGFIVDTYNEVRNVNGTFELINIDKNVFEILEMINLHRFLNIKRK